MSKSITGHSNEKARALSILADETNCCDCKSISLDKGGENENE